MALLQAIWRNRATATAGELSGILQWRLAIVTRAGGDAVAIIVDVDGRW
jgi:hypothetical protein